MGRRRLEVRERSVVKGALAGLVGGLAGSGAKAVAEKIFPPRVQGQTPPPVVLAEDAAGHSLSAGQKTAAKHGIHWSFGALAGAVYGAVMEFEPRAGGWRGAAFGLALNRLTHESLLPRMGLTEPIGQQPTQQPTQERLSEWTTHVVYGVTTECVRRVIRKGL